MLPAAADSEVPAAVLPEGEPSFCLLLHTHTHTHNAHFSPNGRIYKRTSSHCLILLEPLIGCLYVVVGMQGGGFLSVSILSVSREIH